MTTRRLIYLFALISAMIFVVMYSRWFSWYLFIVLLLLVPFDFLISLPGMLSRRLVFNTPTAIDRDSKAILAITTYCERQFPARGIKIKIRRESEGNSSTLKRSCGSAHESLEEIAVDTSQCGVITFSINRMWVVSLLGLFSFPRPCNHSASVLIMPPPIEPAEAIALPKISVLRPKPGGGFGDEHDLREYRQGDPIRSIHWKISAKLNALFIREPMIPPPHNRLVRVLEWKNARECELILGRLRWVADYLLKREMPFYVLYASSSYPVEILKYEDLINYLYQELCELKGRVGSYDKTVGNFTWEYTVDAG